MPALLLVAHSPLAAALAQVASHAYPECAAKLRALDVAPDWSIDQAERAVRAAIAELGSGEVLILTDVFGATPCNAALRTADGIHVRVVAGANVPMLWRTLCYVDEPLDRLVAKAVDGATQGAMQVAAPRRLNQAPNLSSHAQEHDHDQQ